MKLKIKSLTGHFWELDLQPSNTVEELKSQLSSKINLDKDNQKIIYKGKELRNRHSLQDYRIHDADFCVVIPVKPKRNTPSELDSKTPIAASSTEFASPAMSSKSSSALDISEFSPIPEPTTIKKKAAAPLDMPAIPSTSSHSNADSTAVAPTSLLAATSASASIVDNVSQLTSQLQQLVSALQINSSGSANSNNINGNPSANSDSSVDLSSLNREELVARLPALDVIGVEQLVGMGFPDDAVRKAMYLNKMNTQQAMEWLLEHGEDSDINEPLGEQQLRDIVSSASNFVPDPICVQRLADMGFSGTDVTTALRITNNNYEAAASWLLGDREIVHDSDEEGAEITMDENNPLLRSILSNNSVQNALGNERVVQALRQLIDDPSSVGTYLNDPEIGPVILQVHNILSAADDESNQDDLSINEDPEDEDNL